MFGLWPVSFFCCLLLVFSSLSLSSYICMCVFLSLSFLTLFFHCIHHCFALSLSPITLYDLNYIGTASYFRYTNNKQQRSSKSNIQPSIQSVSQSVCSIHTVWFRFYFWFLVFFWFANQFFFVVNFFGSSFFFFFDIHVASYSKYFCCVCVYVLQCLSGFFFCFFLLRCECAPLFFLHFGSLFIYIRCSFYFCCCCRRLLMSSSSCCVFDDRARRIHRMFFLCVFFKKNYSFVWF